jgi:hypothetical protein
MPRLTRKQLVGKTENHEQRARERALRQLHHELRLLWHTQAQHRPSQQAA